MSYQMSYQSVRTQGLSGWSGAIRAMDAWDKFHIEFLLPLRVCSKVLTRFGQHSPYAWPDNHPWAYDIAEKFVSLVESAKEKGFVFMTGVMPADILNKDWEETQYNRFITNYLQQEG